MDAGTVENVVPLQPIQGNFKGVTDVETHPDSTTPATPGAAGASADTGGDDNNPQPDAPPAPSARASGHGRGDH